ncbi:IS5 family transposase, partial [Mesorhizobium sp. M4A.F.Ca.ET.090.04.2.1]
LQPVHSLEPAGCVQPHSGRTLGPGRRHRQADDRCHPSQGASHGSQPAQKGALPRCIGRTRGGLTTKLQVVCDDQGRPLLLHLSEGQANDHRTAAAVLDELPPARHLLADRAYSSTGFREALIGKGITPCIPPHAKHRVQHSYDPLLYRQRHRIENMFARLKDWRRIHTRYDRCAHTFLSAIAFAAAFIFWINEML